MRSTRSITLAPITVGVVWTSCFLYVAVLFLMAEHTNAHNPQAEAQRDLGATGFLVKSVEVRPKKGKIEEIQLYSGPIELWKGELWRIPVNVFHHGGLLHLLMNGCALLYMGKLIEPRLGKIRTLLFYLLAGTIASLVQTLVDKPGIGLSGVAYAQVGLLMVWRDRDEEIAEAFPWSIVVMAGIWLVGCQFLTYANVLHIANAAHFTGLIYGWLFGQAHLSASRSPLPPILFAAGHVFLIPAFWFTMHPFWSGNWHWYQAMGRNVPPQQRLESLQSAVLYDPSLTGAWNELTLELLQANDEHAAFRVALEGLRHNPDDSKLLDLIVAIWATARHESRPLDADLYVSQTFEEGADRWKEKFHSIVDPFVNRLNWKLEDLQKLVGPLASNRLLTAKQADSEPEFLLDPRLPDDSQEQFPAPPINPDHPESALGGMTM